MSRCFPFPPPGYEKKPRTEDADLLKKEKHKEKKHKKDKKDKEKKEVKEKREKDRSDGKSREKKDRKEKHREKKKEKEKEKEKDSDRDRDRDRDRDKNKDKNSTSEERVGGQVEGYNGEKIHPREELDKEKKSRSDEKKSAIQFSGQQGEKPVQSSISVKETENKFVQDLGRRIRDYENGAGSSQLVERFSVVEQKKDDPAGRSAVRDTGMVSEGKNKDKKADTKKMDGQRIRDEARFPEGMVVENCAEIAQNKIEGPTIPFDKKTDRKIEEKNKSRDKENNDKRGDKRKNKDRDKKRQGKERDGEKEKKKEKAKEKSEHNKKAEKDKTKHSSKNDIVCAPSDKSTHLPKNDAETAANEENFKKRKMVETNGFSHDDEHRPKKMPRHSSNISTQNGRKLEPSHQSPGLFPLERQRQVASPINLNKEQKINGIIASPPLSLPKPKPSSSTVVCVSTAKPLSSTANELSVSVGPIPTMKSPFVTANEIAAPLKSVSTARPPPSTSANETSASVTSISATKQPSPVVIAAAERASVSSLKRPSSSAINNKVAKASSSMKPPHPDSKFLSQILAVPKMEDVSDLEKEDQEWLFGSKDGLLKERTMDSVDVDVDEAPQVWAEALRLESVDILALPYVVPY